MLRLFHVELYRNSRRVIVLALLAVYLFLALTGAFQFFSQAQGMYVQQMQEMNRQKYANDPERLEQEMRYLWKVVYAQSLSGMVVFELIAPGILTLTISMDLKKRRVSEMLAMGNSRFSVFFAKSMCFSLFCAVIPVFCSLVNFWINTDTYAGYLHATDIGFLLFDAGYMLILCFCRAMMWLPMLYLFCEPVFGLIFSFLWVLATNGIVNWMGFVPVDLNNHPSGNKLLYYLAGDVSPNWGQETLIIAAVIGLFSFAVAWLIFRRRPLK